MTTLDVVICKFFCLILLIFAKFRCAHFAKINHTANLESKRLQKSSAKQKISVILSSGIMALFFVSFVFFAL